MELKIAQPVYEGENQTKAVQIAVEEPYRGYDVSLAFLTPAGRRCISPVIPLTDGAALYPLPACLLDAPGLLLMQLVAQGGDNETVKSEVLALPVERGVPLQDAEETREGIVTVASLSAQVEALARQTQALSGVGAELEALALQVEALADGAADAAALTQRVEDLAESVSLCPTRSDIAAGVSTAAISVSGNRLHYVRGDVYDSYSGGEPYAPAQGLVANNGHEFHITFLLPKTVLPDLAVIISHLVLMVCSSAGNYVPAYRADAAAYISKIERFGNALSVTLDHADGWNAPVDTPVNGFAAAQIEFL